MDKISKMMTCVLLSAFALFSWASLEAQAPSVSPAACISVKYVTGLWTSLKGDQVAYLLKLPNLPANDNEYRLFSRKFDDSVSDGTLLLEGVDISNVQWIERDRRIAALITSGNHHQIVIVDVTTGKRELVVDRQSIITTFSMDGLGKTVVYSIPDKDRRVDINSESRAKDRAARGYRIDFEKADGADYATQSIFVERRNSDGQWSSPATIDVENPFTHVSTTHSTYTHNMVLSPDGQRLFLPFEADGIPSEWKKNPWVKFVTGINSKVEIMTLYDLRSHTTSVALKTVVDYSRVMWSQDSKYFFVNAHSPIGTRWEEDDVREGHTGPRDVNMFRVDATSGEISEVVRNATPINYHDGPLFLMPDGDVVVRTIGTSITRLHHVDGSWKEVAHVALPQRESDRAYQLTSNGADIIGVHENVVTPGNLFIYKPHDAAIRILTNLNPQLSELRFASAKSVSWSTADGLNIKGLLFMPPDYEPGKRYPLVIQTKGDSGWFSCDSGVNHDPSFAPQPLATSGIMYLARSYDEDWNYQAEVERRPKGYPGGISEAVQQMNIWDSAVKMLTDEGLIDPSKVGIIGFSRTGWHVEFDLVHALTRYAAATATDNVQYSLSDYWLIPSAASGIEAMYGGYPFGNTLDNWKRYSISFNLDKIHTPLLMEEMGYGVSDDILYAVPVNLATHYETVKGLNRLGKPVEMYYYPNEGHQLDHPLAREFTVQRNVDWYRFWLQGYERPDPEDPEQYKRWEHLRELRDADAKTVTAATK